MVLQVEAKSSRFPQQSMFSTSLYIDMCTYIIQDILRRVELQDILRLIELQVNIFCTAQMCCMRFALIAILRLSIKLKFDSENGVHFQLARISHRVFGGPRFGQRETGRNREGLRKIHGSIWEGEEAGSTDHVSVTLQIHQVNI